MNKHTRLITILLATVLALSSLVSCAEGPVGIFASIAAETPINENQTKAFLNTSPRFVAKLGSDYYAGIGVLWKKAGLDGKWQKASVAGLTGTGPFHATSAAVVDVSGTDTLDRKSVV